MHICVNSATAKVTDDLPSTAVSSLVPGAVVTGMEVLSKMNVILLSVHILRFDRGHRDELFRRHNVLRYGEGSVNDPGPKVGQCMMTGIHARTANMLSTRRCGRQVMVTGREVSGWVDCIIATTTWRSNKLLTKLFIDASPGLSKDQVVCKTRR